MDSQLVSEQQAAGWRVPRGVVIFGLVAFVCVTIAMVDRFWRDARLRGGDYTHSYKDAAVWYDAGRRVLEGRPLLRLRDYRYPPTFAVLVSPLCALPSPIYYFVWYLLNVPLFVWAVALALRLAWTSTQPPPPRLFWLPPLLVATYAIDNWLLGQTNVLMTALLYWALVELRRGREVVAGTVLGASIAIKAFTLPLIAYLIYRRRWQAAATSLLSLAFFLFLLPAPVRGFTRNAREVVDWANRVVEPYVTEGKAGDWGQHALDHSDQSLQAVLNRLLTPANAAVLVRGERSFSVNVARLTSRQVNVILLAALALLVGLFIVACGRAQPAPSGYPIEASLASLLLLFVSGIAWPYFFLLLLLPTAVALALLSQRPELPRRRRQALVAALWLQAAAVVSIASPLASAAGVALWSAVVLYVVLAVVYRGVRGQGSGAGNGRNGSAYPVA